jgi:excisionase family DNA binding protein
METDRLLSVEDAAKRLGGISKWTVHAWLSQGKLRRTKVGGRTMIRESELARVIRDEETTTPPKTRSGNARLADQGRRRGISGKIRPKVQRGMKENSRAYPR